MLAEIFSPAVNLYQKCHMISLVIKRYKHLKKKFSQLCLLVNLERFTRNLSVILPQSPSPKGNLLHRHCFLLSKHCMHNEVWGYTEIFPVIYTWL